jgi:integrase
VSDSTLPVARPASELSRELVDLGEAARDYASRSTSANTRKAYRADAKVFTAWCAERDLVAVPALPETIALFLSSMAKSRKVSTLSRYLATISQMHQLAGHESPTQRAAVRKVFRGIKNTHGTAPAAKLPVLAADLRALLAALPDTLLGRRDRALLLVGFAAALRRSELVALDFEHLAFSSEGLTLTLARSKTDQEGAGRPVALPFGRSSSTCPVTAVRAWLEASAISSGPLFRPLTRHDQVLETRLTDHAIARVVKRAAAAAGFDPARLSGHSLRSGFATSCAAAGISEREIMRQTGHRSLQVLRRYIRDGELFRDNPVARLGL